MKRNGMQVLDFHAPALVGRQLTYLSGKQFVGRLVALCFLPYTGYVAAEALDRHAERFQRIDATLLIVSSGVRPFHRLWIDYWEKPWLPVLVDPCGRLHRSFGVAVAEPSPRCHTFVIDREGILRLRVTHDFVDGDLEVLRKIMGVDPIQAADRAAGGENATDITTKCLHV